jgi:hypothetical protein
MKKKYLKELVVAIFTGIIIITGAYLTNASEVVEPITINQSSINLIQEAFDSITPENVSNPRMRMNINPMEVLYDDAILVPFLEELLSPVNDILSNITKDIINSIEDTNSIVMNDIQLLEPISFQHDLFENVRIEIDSSDGLVFATMTYTVYIENVEQFIKETFGISEDFITVQPLNNAYNQIAVGTAQVNDPWNGSHVANLSTSVRFFRRIDNAIFVQQGSHLPGRIILDSRAVNSIDVQFNSIQSNGTANAGAVSTFRVNHVNLNNSVVSGALRDVWVNFR